MVWQNKPELSLFQHSKIGLSAMNQDSSNPEILPSSEAEQNYAVSLKTDLQIIDMQKKLDEMHALLVLSAPPSEDTK